jgi:hypothetical protein
LAEITPEKEILNLTITITMKAPPKNVDNLWLMMRKMHRRHRNLARRLVNFAQEKQASRKQYMNSWWGFFRA